MKTNPHSVLFSLSLLAVCALLASGCAGNKSACCTMPAATTPTAATPTPAAAPAKVALKVVKADSEETSGEDGKAANAVDGDPNTFWHTQWQDASPPCPHEIIIELTPPSTIKGFALGLDLALRAGGQRRSGFAGRQLGRQDDFGTHGAFPAQKGRGRKNQHNQSHAGARRHQQRPAVPLQICDARQARGAGRTRRFGSSFVHRGFRLQRAFEGQAFDDNLVSPVRVETRDSRHQVANHLELLGRRRRQHALVTALAFLPREVLVEQHRQRHFADAAGRQVRLTHGTAGLIGDIFANAAGAGARPTGA